jgi:hypothetical protein
MKAKKIFILKAFVWTVLLFIAFCFEKTNSQSLPQNNSDPIFQWRVPKIPSQFSFAGEKVPLEKWEIREQFDREFTLIYYKTGTMLTLLKYANRWLPFIGERLKQNGIPEDFKY